MLMSWRESPRSESTESLQLVLADGCFVKESPHVASSDFQGEKKHSRFLPEIF